MGTCPARAACVCAPTPIHVRLTAKACIAREIASRSHASSRPRHRRHNHMVVCSLFHLFPVHWEINSRPALLVGNRMLHTRQDAHKQTEIDRNQREKIRIRMLAFMYSSTFLIVSRTHSLRNGHIHTVFPPSLYLCIQHLIDRLLPAPAAGTHVRMQHHTALSLSLSLSLSL